MKIWTLFTLLIFTEIFYFNSEKEIKINSQFQNEATHLEELHFEVNKLYPPISMIRSKVQSVKTIMDINRHFKPSWVKEYIDVEVHAFRNGKKEMIIGKNEVFNAEQKELMINADINSDIEVRVNYIPDNKLRNNEAQYFSFTFSYDPEHDAEFIDGSAELNRYIRQRAIENIPQDLFQGYKLAAVKFYINEAGQVEEPSIFWTSEDEDVDNLLLETICAMPDWKPARYENGLKVRQELALMVGNKESCVSNMLNTRKNVYDRE